MSSKRRRFSAAFKFQVALEAAKGTKTLNELSSEHSVHPNQISQWKRELLENGETIFSNKGARQQREQEALHAELYEQIRRLNMELGWLKKKLPGTLEAQRAMIERGLPELSVRRQCELIGLNRSSLYYQPVGESAYNLQLMRLLDRQYTRTPFYGWRRMTAYLRRGGHSINPKRVRRLMRLMGLQAVYPKPRTSTAAPGHKRYPYLLRGLKIARPCQVWSTDITYLPMQHGFMYLVAVIDWFSRYVLAWQLSNTLDGRFCRVALRQALEQGTPDIFNTDQGAQFTAVEFTSILESASIRISMDGRGRALDNVFVERLWRTVKYENIYLVDYASVPELEEGLQAYFRFYNHERLHQSLAYHTPAERCTVGE